MAGKLANPGSGNALDGALGRVTQTARTVYLALLTAAATQATTTATMQEYSGAGYARQQYTPGASSGTPRTVANTNAINYGPLTGADGTKAVTHWGIVSAQSGTAGDFIAYGDFNTPRTPQAGDSLTVAIGAITVAID
jgi:hypothetical protein